MASHGIFLFTLALTAGLGATQDAWPWSMWRSAAKNLNPMKLMDQGQGLPKFYHTTEQIHADLAELPKTCPGLKVEEVTDNGVTLQAVRYENAEGFSRILPAQKTMLVAGEHAREMIGAEAALSFVKALCDSKNDPTVADAKKSTKFLIVVNANPGSRKKVEKGEFCLRANPNGVDINRNWQDGKWKTTGDISKETNPGKEPFSEPETRMLKKLMDDFQPDTFLNLHSGNLGLYLPNKLAERETDNKKAEKFLTEINDKNCKCPLGVANTEVGYQTCGSSLDYSFEKLNTKFSMAMEIWVHNEKTDELRERWAEQKEFISKRSFLQITPDMPSFIKTNTESDAFEQMLQKQGPNFCLPYFNPDTQAMYEKTVDKWTTTLLELSIKARDMPKDALSSLVQQTEVETPVEADSKSHIMAQPLKVAIGMLGVIALVLGLKKLKDRGEAAKKGQAEAAPLVKPAAPEMVQVRD